MLAGFGDHSRRLSAAISSGGWQPARWLLARHGLYEHQGGAESTNCMHIGESTSPPVSRDRLLSLTFQGLYSDPWTRPCPSALHTSIVQTVKAALEPVLSSSVGRWPGIKVNARRLLDSPCRLAALCRPQHLLYVRKAPQFGPGGGSPRHAIGQHSCRTALSSSRLGQYGRMVRPGQYGQDTQHCISPRTPFSEPSPGSRSHLLVSASQGLA